MENQWSRTELLLGSEALAKLKQARVAVFGVGGVGGQAAEALARSGIGTLDLIDGDRYVESNLNRQIFALHSTLGMRKVDAAAVRLRDIDPELVLHAHPVFFTAETADQLPLAEYDYIIDAIDMVSAKIELIVRAKALGVPVVSAMGAGNKVRPELLEICDLAKTTMDPLARVMRKELRKRGVDKVTVVYSREEPAAAGAGRETRVALKQTEVDEETGAIRSWSRTVGSSVFVPAVSGLLLASVVVNDLVQGAR